ncbi:hypothetical protein C100_03675 [Sphingobium sp. C100]|uniref:HWE histidine kinase domain-containing protein n=1 Tax=Sphingobium sp. C100 TaxID=1207055 RepID=UPI0003D695B3|nr:HWE histidine kinase domain-containing protein [Sphingobium sp. C100]ETI65171.1 hypothetical protein C100_03675 [Sphingobium sp. C100]
MHINRTLQSLRSVDLVTVCSRRLRHRFRNIVEVTQWLVSQTLRTGAPIEDARDRLTKRLAAMGAAVDLLLGAEWQQSSLDAIVRARLCFTCIAPELGSGRINKQHLPHATVCACTTARRIRTSLSAATNDAPAAFPKLLHGRTRPSDRWDRILSSD